MPACLAILTVWPSGSSDYLTLLSLTCSRRKIGFEGIRYELSLYELFGAIRQYKRKICMETVRGTRDRAESRGNSRRGRYGLLCISDTYIALAVRISEHFGIL